MFTIFVNGLVYGIWLLGAMLPSFFLLLLVGCGLYRVIREDAITLEGFMEDFPPEIPTTRVPEPEPEYRFVPSTIVRPPNIMRRRTFEEGEDEDDDKP